MSGIFVPDIEMPGTCIECPFRDKITEVMIGDGVYKKISRCIFSDKHDIEDPWHNVNWMATHKELWCPLVETDRMSVDMERLLSELRSIVNAYNAKGGSTDG